MRYLCLASVEVTRFTPISPTSLCLEERVAACLFVCNFLRNVQMEFSEIFAFQETSSESICSSPAESISSDKTVLSTNVFTEIRLRIPDREEDSP